MVVLRLNSLNLLKKANFKYKHKIRVHRNSTSSTYLNKIEFMVSFNKLCMQIFKNYV